MRGLLVGDTFYMLPGQTVVVRDRSGSVSSTLRRPEMLPPAEIDAALLAIINENYGAGRDELVLAAARAFGFASTSSQLRAVLLAGIDRLTVSGALIEKSGLLMRQ